VRPNEPLTCEVVCVFTRPENSIDVIRCTQSCSQSVGRVGSAHGSHRIRQRDRVVV